MITFVRRIRMRDGHYEQALELLRRRARYMDEQHGIHIQVQIRFGGPVGQVAMVSRHRDAGELERFRCKIMVDEGSSHLLREIAQVTLPGETHDEIWIDA